MAQYKQSAAYTRSCLLVESSDHITALTGATVTVTLSKAGAAFGAAGGAITEIANGWYKIVLTTTDTNTLGDLAFHCTAASGDATDFSDQVLGIDLTAAQLPANVTQINAVATSSVTTINANVGTTQPLNFTGTAGSALVKSDMVDVAGAAVSATTAQLGVNVVNWNNTVVATPSTAGIVEVNVKRINNVLTSSVTAVNANQGTTQPINFTGTGASALAQGDMVDVAGAAVSATTAQLGVNVVNWNGTVVATPATAGIPDINMKNVGNHAVQLDANFLQKVDVEDVNGSSEIETGINLKQALQYTAAGIAGVLSGAEGTTVTIKALNNSGTTRLVATVDTNGNRSAITLT